VIAATLLVVSLLTVLVLQADRPQLTLWPAALAVVPLAAVLALSRRRTTLLLAMSYLLIGGLGTYLYAVVLLSQIDSVALRDAFSLSLLPMALLMVTGPGAGVLPRIGWATAGLLTAQLSTFAAGVRVGRSLQLEPVTFMLFAGTVLVILQAELARRRLRRAPSLLHRAARDEHLAELRFRVELKAAALLHDTILSHLAAIADSTRELSSDLRSQMGRDLEVLVGEEWLTRDSTAAVEGTGSQWQGSALFTAVSESRALGLDVEVTGDPACVRRLAGPTSIALGLAVKQCLVNVLRHSGVSHAEVAVYGSNTDVSVLVVDTGRGFSHDQVGADRFGLRTSVHRRIELVGGSVKVFSTVGRGTSVMIRVPAGPVDAGGEAIAPPSRDAARRT
jgi:signal transduction histidine kinase